MRKIGSTCMTLDVGYFRLFPLLVYFSVSLAYPSTSPSSVYLLLSLSVVADRHTPRPRGLDDKTRTPVRNSILLSLCHSNFLHPLFSHPAHPGSTHNLFSHSFLFSISLAGIHRLQQYKVVEFKAVRRTLSNTYATGYVVKEPCGTGSGGC